MRTRSKRETQVKDVSSREHTGFSRSAIVAVLGRIPEIKGFSKPQLTRIARLKVRFIGPREYVIKEGSKKLDQMTIILGGKVFVRKKLIGLKDESYEQVAEIAGPALIGENSFFTGLPRSAAVFADAPVPCIHIERKDLARLMSLDRNSFYGFMRRIANENLSRAERTLVYYMGTLQLVLRQASMIRSHFYSSLEKLNKRLQEPEISFEEWGNLVKDILLLIRSLNSALEDLYGFANLPEIVLINIDYQKFNISSSHKFHEIYKGLLKELYLAQKFVPLSSLNFKDVALAKVLEFQDKGVGAINYPSVITMTTQLYHEFAEKHEDAGFEAKILTPGHTSGPFGQGTFNDLLWGEL